MKELLVSVGYIVINIRGRHRLWRLVHHLRVGVVTTAAVWVGLEAAFGDPSMDAILICGIPSTLNTIWDKMSKLKIGALPRNSLRRTEIGKRKEFPLEDFSFTRPHCV